MDIDEVRELVGSSIYEVSIHAQQERLAENLDIGDIETAILSSEIIEDYPTDPRGPSCLVSGHAGSGPVHVVIPKLPKWKDNRTRGEKA